MKRAILLSTSSIWAAIAAAAALATIALVVVASGSSALAASSVVNGNFETGDLSGWSVDNANGGYASAEPTYDCTPGWYWWCAQEGSYFASLTPGYPSEYTTISQPFEASKGDRVSGWALFWGDPYYAANGANGQVVIRSDSGTTVATPFEQSTSGESWHPPWTYWEHIFKEDTGAGKFQIEARVQNAGSSDCTWCSVMALDDVKTSTFGSDTTKPSTSATRSVEPNAAGWNKEDVTVKLKATDNEGGWGVKEITYRINEGEPTTKQGDSVPVAVTDEGENTLAYYATDKAGNVEDEQSLKFKIDKTAPTVKSTSPADRATNVPLSAKISATFLESGAGIDPNSLTKDAFTVEQVTRSGYVRVPGDISFDEASKTVTFTPSSPLAKATTYEARLWGDGARVWGSLYNYPAAVEDKADNKMYHPEIMFPHHSWRFSTGGKVYW
jgi:hypothetical protein